MSERLCNGGIKWITLPFPVPKPHYNDVIMSAIASRITNLTIVYSTVYSDADQRTHQSSASLAFVRGVHRWPVNSPAQRASNAENVSIWWRHHVLLRAHRYTILDFIINSLCLRGEEMGALSELCTETYPDSKVHGAHLGPTGPSWAPCWFMNLAIWVVSNYTDAFIVRNKSGLVAAWVPSPSFR